MDIEDFIETQNAFEVMGRFKREGILSSEDIKKAMNMDRKDWISFMREKVGLEKI